MHDYERYIRFLLSEGYEIDVDSEGDQMRGISTGQYLLLSRSKSFDAIKSAMQEVDECYVTAFEPDSNKSVAYGYMVLSNHPSEWLSDYPVNRITRKFEGRESLWIKD
tara:strand:+ start:759 stop:1082 length:324 start_codon:yes stop_codon:yes gene_type:complete